MADIHFTAVIKKILQPEYDPARQKPFKINKYLIEEYNGGQYPETAILEVYDKNGDSTVWNTVLKDLGHFPTLNEEPFEVYFHLNASEGTSQKTGKPYAIQKNLRAWKFGKPLETAPKPAPTEPGTPLFQVPEFNPNQFSAPAQPAFPQQPQQPQFAQSAYGAPQQPQFSQPAYGAPQQPAQQQDLPF